MALAELDVPVVILDLDGVPQAPEGQGILLDYHLPLEQQLPEGLYRQVLACTGLGHFHAPVLPVPVFVHADGQVGGVVAVIVHLVHLPAVLPLAGADPVIHIAVIGNVARGERTAATLRPCLIRHPVGFFVAVCPVLRYKAVHFHRNPSVRQREHRGHAGQIDALAQVEAAVAGQAVGQLREGRRRHHGLPGQGHTPLV